MSMRAFAGALALASLFVSVAAAEPVTVRDIARVVQFSDPHFSPDGREVALVEIRADLESDEFRSEIVLVDVASHRIRQLTRDRAHARSPRWSPSGDALGFLAPDDGHVQQLFVLPMDGGDALQLTHGKDGVQQFAWSPDGATIAYAVSDPKPELKGEDKFRTAFRVDDDDFTLTEAVRPTHIWLVPREGGKAKQLTSGSWSLPSALPPGSPSSPLKWSPDGKSIVFVRQETPSTGEREETHIEVLDVASGKIREVTGDARLEGYPQVSPDGATIAYWRARNGEPWRFHDVFIAPFAGGAGRDIGLALDKSVYETTWMPDGKSLLVGGNVDTTVGLWRLGLDGSVTRLALGDVMPTNAYWMDVDVSRDGQIAFVGQTASDPYELYLVNPGGGATALTHANVALDGRERGRSETVTWKGPAGQTLDGVLTYPKDYRERKRYPLVLYIHGGPSSASRERFGVVEQAMAAHGWVVFEPNYRGSDNMGSAFHEAIYKDAGQGPGEDVMAGVEMLKARGLVDPDRMAVGGWSYGGFMTVWLAGHYNVWKAAVSGAAVTDWVEMYDLSDGNVNIGNQVGGLTPYVGDGMAEYHRQSPDSAVAQIKAPTLIMSDTGDFRVPITQSFGLYRALKDNRVTTEFYAIPVRGHSPSDPVRQMDVYDRWIAWLDKYLK